MSKYHYWLCHCSNFHTPIASVVDDEKRPSRVPAPNSYDVTVSNVCSGVCVVCFSNSY